MTSEPERTQPLAIFQGFGQANPILLGQIYYTFLMKKPSICYKILSPTLVSGQPIFHLISSSVTLISALELVAKKLLKVGGCFISNLE